MPVVVTGGVRTMIGEFKAAPPLRREPVGAVLSGQRAFGDDVQVLEFFEEVVFKAQSHNPRVSSSQEITGERRREEQLSFFLKALKAEFLRSPFPCFFD